MFIRSTTAFAIFFFSAQVFASGWVKTKSDHYAKLSYSLNTSTFDTEVESTTFEQRSNTIGFYGELGLGFLPWKSQLSMDISRLSIERTILSTNEGLTSAALSDLKLIQKHKVASFKFNGTPIGVNLAANTGIILPFTGESFRVGNEADRAGEIGAPTNTDLISSIDRGKFGYIYGLSATLSFKTFWLSSDHLVTQIHDGSYSNHTFNGSLGMGLPLNSWVQLSGSWDKGQLNGATATVSASSDDGENNLSSYTAGFGLTFYKGFALEGAYSVTSFSDESWVDDKKFTIGFSHRSL